MWFSRIFCIVRELRLLTKKKSLFDNFHVPVLNLEQPCICTYKVSTLEISFVIHSDSKSEIEKKTAALVDN